MLHTALILIQIIAGLCIVALVLLQHGQGADAGAGFGAGASGTVFGARGASTALSRATAIFAVVFMLNSAALTYLSTRAHGQHTTILNLAAEAPATSAKKAPAAAGKPQAPAGKPAGPAHAPPK